MDSLVPMAPLMRDLWHHVIEQWRNELTMSGSFNCYQQDVILDRISRALQVPEGVLEALVC